MPFYPSLFCLFTAVHDLNNGKTKALACREEFSGEHRHCFFAYSKRVNSQDFPGGAVDASPPANAGDMGSIPGPGRFHMARSQ